MSFQLRSELSATVERRSGGSAFQTTGAAMEKLRWPMDVFAAKRTDRRDQPNGVTDVTIPKPAILYNYLIMSIIFSDLCADQLFQHLPVRSSPDSQGSQNCGRR